MTAAIEKELAEVKTKWQQTQQELDKTKSELHDIREELERSQSQLDEVLGELEQTHFELHQLKEKGEQYQSQLHQNQKQLEQIKQQWEQTKLQLQRTRKELTKFKKISLGSPSKYKAEFVIKDLLNILRDQVQDERLNMPHRTQIGSLNQRQRIARVAEYCLQNWPGDLIEIGCFRGETTKFLAEIVKKYQKKLIALDPWKLGTQNCQGGEYEAFLKNIEPFKDYVDIVRSSSLEAETIAVIKSRELCFAFVDGLHTYDGCLSDIKTVAHCQGIIAVDDLLWSNEVDRAFHKGAEVTKSRKLYLPICREGYLIPNI